LWEDARRANVDDWSVRGWYHELYRPLWASGARVLDVGSGFGIDGLTWAQHGARVTCADLVPSNLDVLRRLSGILGLETVDFLLIDELSALDRIADGSLDVVYAQGSLHHAPPKVIVPEVARLASKLRVGGRWIQLAYPRERWEREGSPPFDRWGRQTDGDETPYAEWYDLAKLRGVLAPHAFDVVFVQPFHDHDFIWFDLLRRT
jgi:SAM-dependent methyltransferase